MSAVLPPINCDFIAPSAVEEIKLTLKEKLENAKVTILPDTNDYENYRRAENFVIECIAKSDVDEDEARSFIKYKVSEAYHIEGTKGGKMVTDLTKVFRDHRKRYNRERDLAINNNCLEISREFKGLYAKEINTRGELVVSPYFDVIAARIVENLHIISYKDCLYVYVDGKYENNVRLVEAEATRYLNGILRLENSKKITNNLKDVITNVRMYNPVSEYPFNGVKNAINVLNGVIIFDECGEFKLVDPDPDKYKFNYVLPVTFNPEADGTWIMEQIDKYSDKQGAILQILAQMLVQSMGYSPSKIAYFLYGPSDYGKSTVLAILRSFVGKLFASIPLNRMSTDNNNRFSLAGLEGKLLNVKDEMAYFNLSDSATFKDITGSYEISVEPKGVDPYNAISTAVHVFAANDTPTFDGRVRTDEAFWKRWVLIPCTKTKFIKDDKFQERLLTSDNMSAILNEVLKIVSLHIQGAPWDYSNDFGDDKWIEVREEWLKAGNPLYKFVTENMTRGGETYLLKDELLKVVQDWCDEKLLYRKARPESTHDLNEMVKICGGVIDGQKYFFKYTEVEMAEKVSSKQRIPLSDLMVSEKTRCFVLPWTWKAGSQYKAIFRAANTRKEG